MKLTAEMIPALLDDLGAANAELEAIALQAPAHWDRGPEGKWTISRHLEHVAMTEALAARCLEQAIPPLRAGTLGRRPWRDPLQAMFVGLVTGSRFPRGGKAVAETTPSGALNRDAAFAALDDALRRLRAVAAQLQPGEAERLWFRNPFTRLRWHYTFPEILRVQANHTRHHARSVAEFLVAAGVARNAA